MRRPGLAGVVLSLATLCTAESALAGDGCVVNPDAVLQSRDAGLHKTTQIGTGTWMDGIYVLPYTYPGEYDKEIGSVSNAGPRQWVTESFFSDSPDTYDFVVVFTNFDWDSGNALGVYWSIANDVEGIGLDLFDYSQFWGSENLQGYIDARRLTEYLFDDSTVDTDRLHEILNHEIGHRFLVHPTFLDDGIVSHALLGRDGSHWSFLLDSDASFMYGSEWRDNGDGTFSAVAAMERYSPLDLYLMGLFGADEVPDMALLVNPDINPEDLPFVGGTINASAQTIRVGDVVAAEGPRFPDAAQSQKAFRVGVIYLVSPGSSVTESEISTLGELRHSWVQDFFEQTAGRAIVDVVAPPDVPSGGGSANLEAAIGWLVGEANSSGGVWRDSPVTWVRETADAAVALDRIGGYGDVVSTAVGHLYEAAPVSTELEARRLFAVTRDPTLGLDESVNALLADGDAERGWAAFPRYGSDSVTTARTIRALGAAERLTEAQSAWSWLADCQNDDGGWGWQKGQPSTTIATLEVLLAAREIDPEFWDRPNTQGALNWLLQRQVDGGLGEPHPNSEATALFLLVVEGQVLDQGTVQEAVDFLAARQMFNGSWESSAHVTALAVNALATFSLPDPFVDQGLIVADPNDPYDDETIALVAAIRNSGTPVDAGVPFRWEVAPASNPAAPIWSQTGNLPAVPDVGFVSVNATVSPPLPAGLYDLRLVIDPDREHPEQDRRNNIAQIRLEVAEHPAGVDLEISSASLVLDPADVSSVPQAFLVHGTLGNNGQTSASGAVVRIYDGDPSEGSVIGEGVVSVAALSQEGFSIPAAVAEAKSVTVTVVADPDRVVDDAFRFNNTAVRTMPLRYRADVQVVSGSFTARPETVGVGEETVLEAMVHNTGTLPVSDIQVAFSYEWGTPAVEYAIQNLTLMQVLEPGEAIPVTVAWSPNVSGEPLTVSCVVDPSGATGDVDVSNNRAQRSLFVTPSDLPNLVADPLSISFTPGLPLQGTLCTVGIDIANPTINDAGPFVAEVWIDAIGSGTLLGSIPVAGVGAGETVQLNLPWDVLDPEDRLIYLVVDPENAIVEFREDDNQAFVEADVQTLPDLVVTGGGVPFEPSFPTVGDLVTFDVLVGNLEDQDSPPSLLELLAEDGTIIDSVAVPGLSGHSETTLQVQWDTAGFVGATELSVHVDRASSIAELVEDNNRAMVSVGVQDADIFLANQIFSPNGDGVKDVTTVFYRAGGSVSIETVEGRVLRTLVPDAGQDNVVWDGLTDKHNLVPDGLYVVTAGEASTWVVVDTNRFAITNELEQRLLVGFISPRVPGQERPRPWDPEHNIERSWFTSVITSSVGEAIYLVERYHAEGTASNEDTFTLWQYAADQLLELGELPAEVNLLSVDARGDVFVTGSLWGSNLQILRVADMSFEPISSPGGWDYVPWISPDGRWLLWVSSSDAELFIEDLTDPGGLETFFPDAVEDTNVCGYSVSWTAGNTAVVAMNTDSKSGFYQVVDVSRDEPFASAFEVENWSGGCGWGGGGTSQNGSDGEPRKHEAGRVEDPDAGLDFDQDSMTWLTLESEGGYGGDKRGSGLTLEASVFDLSNGERREANGFEMGWDRWADVRSSLSNNGHMTSVQWEEGGWKRHDGETELTSSRRFIWIDSDPESDREIGKAYSPVGQYLVDWRTEAARGLPLLLDAPLWTPPDTYLIGELDPAQDFYSDNVPYFTPAANLKMRVKTRVLFGDAGIDLWVLATDRHLETYQLEYSVLDGDPDVYFPIGVPSNEPLYDDRWGTWIPPGNGRYRVRIAGRDRAGNVRSYSRRVTWNGDNDIANLYTESRYMSPLSSPGIKDVFTFHYTVLRPANLEFAIQDQEGVVLANIHVAADEVGPRTTIWNGFDLTGNPVEDGEYALVYGEASWPIVVDNSPPLATLRFEDSRYVRSVSVLPAAPDSDEPPECEPGNRDEFINQQLGRVADDNLLDWDYQVFVEDDGTGSWLSLVMGTEPIGEETERLLRRYASDHLANRQFRFFVRDLAGNETVAIAAHREEWIRFTDSEPGCRSNLDPCIYPNRPSVDQLMDTGGLLEPDEPLTLNLFYDTLLVQSTVWGSADDIRLEFREASIAGLPAGPWAEGTVVVGSERVTRSFRTLDEPFVGECDEQLPAAPTASLVPVFWDHPNQQQTPYEVRLIAVNEDGLEIESEPRLFYPETPLALVHEGVDHRGDIFKLTNLSNGVVRTPKLQIRRIIIRDGVQMVMWEHLMPIVDRLAPGANATFATGCVLVTEGGGFVRAAGQGGFGGEALSNLAEIPDREGFSRLRTGVGSAFEPGSCPSGSPAGEGLFGIHNANPCGGEPSWPSFWVNQGLEESVEGRVPVDPSGVTFSRYEILVDGVPFVTVDGPQQSADYLAAFDLTALADGHHLVTERYSYAAEPGLLGQCPQSFSLTIDRTPPVTAISEPLDGSSVCPNSSSISVALSDQDETSGRLHRVFMDGRLRDTSATGSCLTGTFRPFSGGDGASYSISDLYREQPGWHEITAVSIDRAGFATCAAPVSIYIPDLPHVEPGVLPRLFSPLNTLDRPLFTTFGFTTNTPGDWDTVLSRSGVVYQADSGEVFESDERIEVLWDGTQSATGLLAPDGRYEMAITARSPCGAEHSAEISVELDTTPPEISISSPWSGATIGAVVEVIGTAWDPPTSNGMGNFEAAVIEVLPLDGGADVWTVVGGFGSELNDAPDTMGRWVTSGFLPGDYLLRVRAWDEPGNETVSPEIQLTVIRRHFIETFDREPALISPNQDGALDTGSLAFSLYEDAVVTLMVVNGSGNPVATLIDHVAVAAAAGTQVMDWDGLSASGEVVPDGRYTLVLRAEDPSSPPIAPPEEERLSLTVDTIPPVIEYLSPEEGALVGLPLEIRGSHQEIHVGDWIVSIDGEDVSDQIVGSGASEFVAQTMARINDGQIPDGDYISRFEAVDAGENRSVVTRGFRVDNTLPEVLIHEPQFGTPVNTVDEPLHLFGEVLDANLREWAWSSAPGAAPDQAAFVTFRGGPPTQEDGAVDSYAWDASNLPDGPHTVRLCGIDVLDQENEALRTIIVDNTPPVVTLVQPAVGAVVGDPLEVVGAVADANLAEWRLAVVDDSGVPLDAALASGDTEVDGVLVEWVFLPPDGSYDLVLSAMDAAGNEAEVSVSILILTVPPSPPVIVSAELLGRDTPHIVWTPGPGPTPEGYLVYRDGVRITQDPVDRLDWTDSALPSGTYVYTVRAVTQTGSETDDSNSAEMVIDLRPPLASIVLPADGARVSDQVSVFGTATRDTGFAGWQLWATFQPSGSPVLIGSGLSEVVTDLLTVWDTAQPTWVEGPYLLVLEASDVFGNNATDTIMVEVDNTPPEAPTLTTAYSQALDPDTVVNDIRVEWTLEPPPPDLAGFYLYRNGQLANAPGPVLGSPTPFLIEGTAYDDRDLPDGTYVYHVVAADTADNESAASNESDPVVIDTRRPHAVIVDPPDGTEFEQATVLTAECVDLDVESVVFEVLPESATVWAPLGPPLTSPPPWTMDFAPAESGSFQVRAVASDAFGPDPDPESISLVELDLPPAQPTNLVAVVDGGEVSLAWDAVADPYGDLAGYRVYRDGELLTPSALPASQLDYVDSGLADDWYGYEVSAVDTADHESDRAWTDIRVVSPSFAHVFPIMAASSITLHGRSEEYNETVEWQRRVVGGAFETIADLPAGEEDVTFPAAPLNQGANVFRIRGSDSVGNRSRWSRSLVLVRNNVPDAPGHLQASVIGADVDLTWDPSADPDFLGFTVARNGLNLTTASAIPFAYNGASHALEASSGTATEWQAVVDGDAVTGWQPGPSDAQAGPWWQWTWTDGVAIDSVSTRWGADAAARRFSVEVRIDGEWLWWQYFEFNYAEQQHIPIGMAISGVRVVVPPGTWCSSCTLAEVSLEAFDLLSDHGYSDLDVADQAFEYDVWATNRYGQESLPTATVVQVGGDEVSTPASLTVVSEECASARLTWSPPEPLPAGHLGYRMYRAEESEVFEFLIQLPADAVSFLDSGLGVGTTVRYRMTAIVDIDGAVVESQPTPEASVLVDCPVVPDPVLLDPTTAGVPISWPTTEADIGGRAWPGSDVTLIRDGEAVGSISIPDVGTQRIVDLPAFATSTRDLRVGGGFVAYPVGDGFAVADLASGERTVVTHTGVRHLAVDPLGRRLAYTGDVAYDEQIFTMSLATGDVAQLTFDGDSRNDMAFASDGRSIATVRSSWPESVVLIDVGTGEETSVFTDPWWNGLSWPVVSDNGAWLAVRTWGGFWVVDLETGDELFVASGSEARMSTRPFSPDGRYFCWTEYPDSVPHTAYVQVYDLHEGATLPAGAPGTFAAVFVETDTLAMLRTIPAKAEPVTGGDLEVVYRSVLDGHEQTVSNRLAMAALSSNEDEGDLALLVDGDGSLWVPQGERLVGLRRPTGRFTIPDVPLAPGVNTITASQLFEGDVAMSQPIEISVAPDEFGDANVLGILATPGHPLVGDRVQLEAVIQNAGHVILEDLLVTLVRNDDQGVSHSVLVETVDLRPGAVHRVRATWDTTGSVGGSRWEVSADPIGSIAELDEENNQADVTVVVRDHDGAEAEIETAQSAYRLGSVVPFDIRVSTFGSTQDYDVETRIETIDGTLVDILDQRTLDGGAIASDSWGVNWVTDGMYPGEYRGRVLVASQDGETVDDVVDFELYAVTSAMADGTVGRPNYVRGQNAQFSATITNTGQALLVGGSVQLAVESVGGGPLATDTRPLQTLTQNATATLAWSWSTGGAPLGLHQFVVRVFGTDGTLLAASDPDPFTVEPEDAQLVGEIAATPNEFEPGAQIAVVGTVRNTGDQSLFGIEVSLSIVDLDAGQVIEGTSSMVDLPVGSDVPVGWNVTPDLPRLDRFVVVLTAERHDVTPWRTDTLASTPISAVDRTPPQLQLLEPEDGPFCDIVEIRARAVDALSGVTSVTYLLDDEHPEVGLDLESLEDTIWASTWFVQDNQVGLHQIAVRAEDASGNQSDPIQVAVDVLDDREAPVVTIVGPADGSCVPGPVSVVYGATDDHPASVTATLDGVPYASGDPIPDGAHALSVIAVDQCGHETGIRRVFAVDSLAPVVTVDGVVDGAVYAPPLSFSWQVDDPNLVASSATLNGSAVLDPVTLDADGDYVLALAAADCAGNTTEVTVGFTVGTGVVALTSTLDSPAEVEPPAQVEASAEVINGGTTDLTNVTLRLRLVDPLDGSTVWLSTEDHDIAVGTSALIRDVFPTDGLEIRMYRLQSEAAGMAPAGLFDQVLTSRELQVVDRTPPTIAVVSPTDGIGCNPVALLADVVDLLSPVDSVWALMDDATDPVPLTFLPGDPDPGHRWGATLDFGPGAAGQHSIRIFGRDAALNESPATLVEFVVDAEPPTLVVDAPPDGSCHGETVTLSFEAMDPGLDLLEALLDGQFVASPAVVDQDGVHEFHITASDRCGFQTTFDSVFVVDTIPPVIIVDGIVDGGVYQGSVTMDWTIDDENLTESIATLDGSEVQPPLDVTGPGDHTLIVAASDCAGNWTQTVFEFSVEGQPPLDLSGSLSLSATVVEGGDPLIVTAEVTNQGGVAVMEIAVVVRIVNLTTGASTVAASGTLDLASGDSRQLSDGVDTWHLPSGFYRAELSVSGDYGGQPYDLVLDEQGFEIQGPVPVPGTGRVGLLLMIGLVAVAGVVVLRRLS